MFSICTQEMYLSYLVSAPGSHWGSHLYPMPPIHLALTRLDVPTTKPSPHLQKGGSVVCLVPMILMLMLMYEFMLMLIKYCSRNKITFELRNDCQFHIEMTKQIIGLSDRLVNLNFNSSKT